MAVKTFDLVSYEKKNRIAWITIHNEERMNALSTGVNNGLHDSFEEADNDNDVLVIVLTGGGGRAFCAGADLKEMTERDQTIAVGARQNARHGGTRITQTLKPVIAAVDGYALAGGMQLSARCDFRIATAKSVFGMPEPLRSLTPINLMDTLEWASSRSATRCGSSCPARTSPRRRRTGSGSCSGSCRTGTR